MTAREVTLAPCPRCGAQPITDPNARGYHTSSAWTCGTVVLWTQQGKTRQSARCKDAQEANHEG